MKTFTVVLAAYVGCGIASGHGVMTRPISRSLMLATNATVEGSKYAGECPGGTACTWYNQKTVLPAGQNTTNCEPRMRTMGVSCADLGKSPTDFPCTSGHAVPWCAPGTAPVRSPCGIFSGGYQSNGRDMRDLAGAPQATWAAGSVQDVAWAITANHGGGFAYRLCRAADSTGSLTEECFQANHLAFAGTTQQILDPSGATVATLPAVRTTAGTHPAGSEWARNPFPMEDPTGYPTSSPYAPIPGLPHVFGRGPFNYSVQDQVQVPAGLAPGHYVLSWRWDAEQTKQVWSQCSDVLITSNSSSSSSSAMAVSAATASPVLLPSGQKHVCTGASLGLDVGDCDAWVETYDALGGAAWPETWRAPCPGHELRTDPCGCNGYWQKFVRCNAKRDWLRITEIYMLGPSIVGTIPSALGQMDALLALSLVGTRLTGTIPDSIGELPNLEMVWMDHNPTLGGAIPQSFLGRSGKLQAFELHTSGFSGVLPALDWASIADCTLNGLVFDCPLPKGAETCGCTCK